MSPLIAIPAALAYTTYTLGLPHMCAPVDLETADATTTYYLLTHPMGRTAPAVVQFVCCIRLLSVLVKASRTRRAHFGVSTRVLSSSLTLLIVAAVHSAIYLCTLWCVCTFYTVISPRNTAVPHLRIGFSVALTLAGYQDSRTFWFLWRVLLRFGQRLDHSWCYCRRPPPLFCYRKLSRIFALLRTTLAVEFCDARAVTTT
jgi:hypothetical protein